MYLGIEIGGTKLQMAVGQAGRPFTEHRRWEIEPGRGSSGILNQIASAAPGLIKTHGIRHLGIGFGGPVDRAQGRVITSHQVRGWDNLALAQWCEQSLGVTAAIGNDCDAAAMAEATCGAGQGHRIVFYVTVGSGVGGGLVIDGQLYAAHRPAVAEIGHLRPGLHADRPDATVESLASGWGIAAAAQARVSGQVTLPLDTVRNLQQLSNSPLRRQVVEDAEEADREYVADLLGRCHGNLEDLSALLVAQAAIEGNALAAEVLDHAIAALGWAIAQVVTITAAEIVVVGGGVSLLGEQAYFAPLRRAVQRYIFPPLADSFQLAPAALGENVVLHGALLMAQTQGE